MKRLALLALTVGCCSGVGYAHAEEDAYNTYPIEGTVQSSSDGRYWTMDLLDTDNKRGTLSIDAETGVFDAVWGNTAESGVVPAGTTLVEKEAAKNPGTYNGDGSGGGTHLQGGPSRGRNNIDSSWVIIVPPVVIAIAACAYMNRNGQRALSSMYAACSAGGGSASGGSVGSCGRVSAPTCFKLHQN